MSMTFTKLFSSITASTIWAEPDHTRLVWITMLAMADQHGRVWASIPGLANMARVTIEKCEAALEALSSPDKYSRTKEHEGRRIEEMDGGWRLLNHAKYRAIRDEESIKQSKRDYINKRRAAERVETVEQSRTESNSVEPIQKQIQKQIKEIEPSALVSKADAYQVPNCPFQDLEDLYHAHCPSLPRMRVKTQMRLKHAQARWKQVCVEEKFDAPKAIDWFKWYFERAEASDFLTGRSGGSNGRTWRADFDWLVKPESFAKVVEGRYHGEKV